MILQLDEQGKVIDPNDRIKLSNTFKEFAGKEIEIKIVESGYFQALLDESIKLQNQFSQAVNNSEANWTNEDFTVLRSKMSHAYYKLIDEFAKAKSEEKTAEFEKDYLLETLKCGFIDQEYKPTEARSKAIATDGYKTAFEKYTEAYKIRTMLQLYLESLDKSMNAIAGIQKHDVNKLKF